ncbi:MAG: methyl-accepting chemotaxis protein, partial [Pseudomonas sp.]|nr:methyl-accepting chemotaxis protein [Pseudomonas sp.]
MRTLWNTFSLRLRLFLSFGVLFALMTGASLVLQSYFYSQERITRLVEQELPAQLEHLAAEIRVKLAPSIQASQSLASNTFILSWIKEGMPDSQFPLIREQIAVVGQQLDIEEVFLVANDSQRAVYYDYKDRTLQQHNLSTSAEQDAWYFNYIKRGQAYELERHSNELSDGRPQMYVNYTGEVLNSSGEPLSVAGVGINMQMLADTISAYRLGQNGRAFLVNKEGQVGVYTTKAPIIDLKNSTDLKLLFNSNNIEIHQVNHQGQDLFIGRAWIADLQRYLVVEVPRSDFLAAIDAQLYQSLFIGGLLLLVSLLLLYPLAVSLSRPLVLFQKQLVHITHTLDLSQRLDTKDKAELGDLAAQTNSLLERLAIAIGGVQQSSTRLSETAQDLAYTAGLVSRHTGKQQEVTQSMASAVEEMSSSVAEITSTMEELSVSSTQIADHSQSVVEVANLTLESSKRGADAMQNLQARMTEIHHDSESSLNEIVRLGSKSKEISKVMDFINTLAGQTKLIAFNAALEASSAGESGKRFSVVASEIRRLADSVTDSTREIEEHIQETQDSINRLVITSEKGAGSIQLGMKISSETAQDLSALVQAASKTS